MKRVELSDDAEQDKFGAGKHGHTNGDPGVTPATTVDDDWLDHVQEEIAGAVEGVGQTVDGSRYDQLRQTLLTHTHGAAYSNIATEALAAGGVGSHVNGVDIAPRVASPVSGTPAADRVYEAVAVDEDGRWHWKVGDAAWSGGGVVGGGNALNGVFGDSDAPVRWVAVGDAGTILHAAAADAGVGSGTSATGGNLTSVVYDANNSLYIACGTGGEIETATTPGGTWTSRSSTVGSTLHAPRKTSPTAIVVGGSAGVVRSTDGVNWSTVGSFSAGSYRGVLYSSIHDRWIAVGSTGKCNYSTDDGLTWTEVTIGDIDCRDLSEDEAGVLVCVGRQDSGADARMYMSTDGGETWRGINAQRDRSTSFQSVALEAGIGFIGDEDNTLWRTQNLLDLVA